MGYSPEQLNFFRLCFIAFNLLPDYLRKIFKQEWDFLYSATAHGKWEDTAKNGMNFYKTETKKGKKTSMKTQCLNIVRNGNTAEWDCTCLFSAILYSNAIGSTVSPAVRKAVDDIRQVRNGIAHMTKAELSDADFNKHVGTVITALSSLGLPVKDIEDVKNQTSFPTDEVENFKKKVHDLQTEVDKAKHDLNQTKSDLDQTKSDLNQTKSDLNQTKSDLGKTKSDLDQTKSDLDQRKSELDQTKSDLNQTKSRLDQTKYHLDQTNSRLDQTQSDLKLTKNTLVSTQVDLQSAKEENKILTHEINSNLEPFCFLALKPPHELIRRSSDIERISNKMQELRIASNGTVSTIYLSGNPGCGKSQLARQLGSDFFSKRSDNAEDMTFVATLNAECIETLADSYITLGRHLGITEYALTNLETSKREKPGETIQQLIRLILPQVRKYSSWLIIADNIIDSTLVRRFLPQIGDEEWGHGQVLITTQDSSALPRNAPHMYHESFSKGMQPEDAVKLLEKVSQICDREETVENVAKVLDHQPLALAAAGYYVQTVVKNGSPKYSWTNYLEGLTHSQREATENILAKESSAYSKTSKEAVEMALKRAIVTDDVLHQTFSFFALCACDVLPLDAVVEFVKGRITDQPEELIKAKILKSSLILVSADEHVEDTFLGLHNIVHTVLKQRTICNMESPEKFQNMADAVKVFKSLLQAEMENFALLNKLTHHCKSLLEHMMTSRSHETPFVNLLTPFITDDEVVEWLDFLAHACKDLSDFSFAKSTVDLACSLLQNISDTSEGAILKSWILNCSGVVYGEIGKHNQAKGLHKDELIILKEIFGEEHPSVATSYSNLGRVYDSLGEYNQAKELYEKAHMIQKKILREEHPSVATSYSNLGSVYDSLGEYNQAKELYEKALMIEKKIFGEEHPSVATSYSNLASVYDSLGEYNQAKELHEKALMIQKKIFGEENPSVATSYSNLGRVYVSLGECNKAKELHEKALMIEKKIFEEEHPSVATSYSNLGNVYYRIGEYNQAKQLYEKALMIQKKILGEEHPSVATSYSNLGSVYDSLGEYNMAKELYEKALMIQKKIFGEEHPYVATSYSNLGSVYYTIGEYNQAKELHEKALMIQKKIFGEEHPSVATSYSSLGSVYYRIGEYNQAKELYEKALMIEKKIFGEEHPSVATSYSNLGSVYVRLGECNKAKELYEKALMIQKKIFGEEHPSVATSYSNLGSVYDSLGEYNQAKELYEKALMIQKKILGEEHPSVATSYSNLGSVYDSLGEYNQAKELYEKALMIQKKIFGEEHPSVATSYSYLGSVYDSLGEYNQAKELHEKTLMIQKKIFGEEHPSVATSYSNLGSVYVSLGECNKAKELYEKALMIQKEIFGEEHPSVATSYNNLGSVYYRI